MSGKDTEGFSIAIGNGIFWLIPFALYFIPMASAGFTVFDNGLLTDDLERCIINAHLAILCSNQVKEVLSFERLSVSSSIPSRLPIKQGL